MMQSLRRDNLLYGLAWGFLLLVVFIGVFGTSLMPHGIAPEDKIFYRLETIDGVEQKVMPPFAPNADFWLGTDHRGYDLLSLLLNGAKYTLGFALGVTIMRFLIAVPLGLFAGTTGRGRSVLTTLQLITGSVPALLLIFPTMHGLNELFRLNQGVSASDPKMILFTKVLVGLMVFVGVFQLAHQFAERADYYRGRQYVTAARMMGASNVRIVFRHILPHLRVEMLFAFLIEMVQVLFLLGQLAVVFIFVGGGDKVVLADATPLSPEVSFLMTTSGEWGGLIAYGSRYLREYPWIILGVGACFIGTMFILLFFSSQLRKRFNRQTSVPKTPLLQNKPMLTSIGGAVVACALLLTFLPDQGPASNVVTMAQTSGSGQEGQNQESTDGITEELKRDLTSYSEQFMGYLVKGQWEYAEVVLNPVIDNAFQPVGSKPIGREPFEPWMDAFLNKSYQFVKVGEISKKEERTYEVEIQVVSPSGQPDSWFLIVHDRRQRAGMGMTGLGINGARGKAQ